MLIKDEFLIEIRKNCKHKIFFFLFLLLVVFPNQHIYVVVVINDYKVGRGSRYSISCNISLMINIDPTFSTLSLNLLSRLLTANQPVSFVMVKAVHIDLYIPNQESAVSFFMKIISVFQFPDMEPEKS